MLHRSDVFLISSSRGLNILMMSLERIDLNLKLTLHLCTLSLNNDSATVVEDINVSLVELGISTKNFLNAHATF